ncbi:HD domain-containing protein [Granulicella sp. dw_53]|uniref:HD domain-containing protein n=1 Tax=Granulicella sp. dw_53 TaxID=2719792 RepID=UPI001BD4C625|nr:HD domain-containing protein [Granulicella sp. dw_53]
MSNLTDRVRTEVIQRLNNPQQSVAHRFDHIERVWANAKKIAATIEDVDHEILELAVLLHDVEQHAGKKAEHVESSVRTAEQILQDFGCPANRIDLVLNVIAQHSTEHVETVKPSTNEARILFDADKLDGIGAVGIARVFGLFGQMNLPPFAAIAWYRGKIAVSLKHVQTEEGSKLFQSNLAYVEEFLARMESQALEASAVSSNEPVQA